MDTQKKSRLHIEPQSPKIFSREYRKLALSQFKSPKMLVVAALITALRIAVKSVKIPVGDMVFVSIDFFVNSLGSMIYGPAVGLLVGAVSDTVGALLFPSGAYFFPFIIVEMLSSFIFALFFWQRKLSSARIIAARFTVVVICNFIVNPFIMKFYRLMLYGKQYRMFNLVRITKNILLFPLESLLLILFLDVMRPLTDKLGFTKSGGEKLKIKPAHIVTLVALSILSAVCIFAYYRFFVIGK